MSLKKHQHSGLLRNITLEKAKSKGQGKMIVGKLPNRMKRSYNNDYDK
jgi:hypothetical protein